MPSPWIPRSKAAPDINSQSSSSHFVSSSLPGGLPIASGTKIPGTNITGKTRLTKVSLRELIGRNALEEARISTSSPYYNGLTDFSLVINQKRLSGSSHGRESRAKSSISSGSKPSFVVKMHEWSSSWFTLKKHENNSNEIAAAGQNLEDRAPLGPARTHNQIRDKSTKTGSEYDEKIVTIPSVTGEDTVSVNLSTKEKPLREKESEPPSSMMVLTPPTGSPPEDVHCPLPQITQPTAQAQPSLLSIRSGTPPPVQPALESLPSLPPKHSAAVVVTYKNKQTTKMIDNERKYVWADRYRPSLLKDFICNRTTALQLQSRVRNWHNKAEECGHFIFEGSPGVGKRTMIWALLREAFGPDKVQVQQDSYSYDKKKQLNFIMKKHEPRLYYSQAREESKEFHLKVIFIFNDAILT